ncbi:MAG: lipase family protein [Microbacterium hominis]|nr:lipase family protein [Microbacterium hominis]
MLPSVAADIVAGLSKGWYVSVPDHEGPKAAFISGVTAAYCGIDALRATLNFTEIIPDSQGYKAVYHGYEAGSLVPPLDAS